MADTMTLRSDTGRTRVVAAIRAPAGQRLFVGFAILAVAAVVLQKIGLPVPGGELGFDTPLILVVLAYLFWRRVVVLDGVRVAAFGLFIACAAIGMLSGSGDSGLPAFGVLVALYVGLCFVAPAPTLVAERCLRFFQSVIIVVAGIVLAQQLVQYTVGHRFWPNLDAMLPPGLLYDGFAYQRAYAWGSPYLKPNGVFFLEPSAVSLYVGAALAVELIAFQRIAVAALLGAGMLATLAGTGPVMILLASPLLILKLPLARATLLASFAAIALLGAGVSGALDPFFARAGELSDPKSSGYARIVVPFTAMAEELRDPARIITGRGAGSSPTGVNVVQWPIQKLTYEYGLLAAVAFHLFLLVAMLGRPVSRTLAVTILIPHELFGGGFVSHANVMLLILLGTLLSAAPSARAGHRRSGRRAVAAHGPSDSVRDTPP